MAHRILFAIMIICAAAYSADEKKEAPKVEEKAVAKEAQPKTFFAGLGSHQSWEEKMLRQLDKKVSVELTDEKLSSALNLVSDITGLIIIIDPKVARNDPKVTLKVSDMDAGTFIKWCTRLTETYAEVKDAAIFITDKPSQTAEKEEKEHLMLLAMRMHAEIELPPDGTPLTEQDRVKIALKLMEKEEIKPTDFPGPEISIGTADNTNPFIQK